MNAIAAAKRLHHAYEQRVWRARLPGYTRRTWAELDHVCRQEFIDIAQAIHDGHTTFNGHPITEWVRHHAKDTPCLPTTTGQAGENPPPESGSATG